MYLDLDLDQIIRDFTVNVRHQVHDCDVYVGRPNPRISDLGLKGANGFWGNPFHLDVDTEATRLAVLQRYFLWLLNAETAAEQRMWVRSLRGRRLGCWCHPRHCHAHVLAILANTGWVDAPDGSSHHNWTVACDHAANWILDHQVDLFERPEAARSL